MIVMLKSKFIQKLTFAISVECLCSNLLAKLLMHNCAHAIHVNLVHIGFCKYRGMENKCT